MSADNGAVDEVQAPIDPPLAVGLGLQGFQDVLPDPGLAPAIEPARHRANRAIAARQVVPGRAGAVDPENAVQDPAVIVVRPAGARLLRWQERFQPLPLNISQVVTSHTGYMGSFSSTCQEFAEAP